MEQDHEEKDSPVLVIAQTCLTQIRIGQHGDDVEKRKSLPQRPWCPGPGRAGRHGQFDGGPDVGGDLRGQKGTAYSFSNSSRVVSQLSILDSPDLKNTVATTMRMSKSTRGEGVRAPRWRFRSEPPRAGLLLGYGKARGVTSDSLPEV